MLIRSRLLERLVCSTTRKKHRNRLICRVTRFVRRWGDDQRAWKVIGEMPDGS